MRLSIVSTLFYSEPYLDEFHARISRAAEEITSDFEILLVNDGSPDDALAKALDLFHRDKRVKVLDLSRNFGHHRAMMTGLEHARGELVFLIDCDLEEEPELLGLFHDRLQQENVDVVYGVQKRRKGGWLERVSGRLFFILFNMLSTDPIPTNLVVARLMTRRYVRALIQHQERELLIAGLWTQTGFDQTAVPIEKHHKGSSSYSMARKVSYLVNAVTSFSNKPLAYIFYLGCLILGISLAGAAYLTLRRLFWQEYLAGWPSLMVAIAFLGGLIVFCQGVIGIYLSKIFSEVKNRPYTIIREIHEHQR